MAYMNYDLLEVLYNNLENITHIYVYIRIRESIGASLVQLHQGQMLNSELINHAY